MRVKRHTLWAGLLTAVLVAVPSVLVSSGAAQAKTESAQASAKTPQITVCASVLSTDVAYYAQLLTSYENAGKSLGLKVIGLNANYDSETLANEFSDCVAEGAKVIIATPVDTATLKSVAQSAMKKGVAVIIQGEEPSDVSWASADVGYSEQAMGTYIGQLCAQCLIRKYPKVTTWEVGNCTYPVMGSTIIRMNAAEAAVKANAKGHKVVFEFAQPCGTQQTGYTVTTDGVTAHPQVRSLVSVNDDSSIGAVKAFEAKGIKPSTLCLVGAGNDADVDSYVKDGQIYGTVDLNLNGLALAAMRLALEFAHGQKLAPMTYLPMTKVTAANVAKFTPKNES
jgi:ribose transport system substrate-binding protein